MHHTRGHTCFKYQVTDIELLVASTDCGLFFPSNKLSQVGGCWLALVQLLSKYIQNPSSPFFCSVTYTLLTVHFLTYHLMITIWLLQQESKPNAKAGGKAVNFGGKRFSPCVLDSSHRINVPPLLPTITSPDISTSSTGPQSQLLCTELTWRWAKKVELDLSQNVICKKYNTIQNV